MRRCASAYAVVRAAGKHTHADGFLSIVRYIIWEGEAAWVSGIATPNSVFSGTIETKVNPEIKNLPQISYSNKFPGLSLNVGAFFRDNPCTPEIYLKRCVRLHRALICATIDTRMAVPTETHSSYRV